MYPISNTGDPIRIHDQLAAEMDAHLSNVIILLLSMIKIAENLVLETTQIASRFNKKKKISATDDLWLFKL